MMSMLTMFEWLVPIDGVWVTWFPTMCNYHDMSICDMLQCVSVNHRWTKGDSQMPNEKGI